MKRVENIQKTLRQRAVGELRRRPKSSDAYYLTSWFAIYIAGSMIMEKMVANGDILKENESLYATVFSVFALIMFIAYFVYWFWPPEKNKVEAKMEQLRPDFLKEELVEVEEEINRTRNKHDKEDLEFYRDCILSMMAHIGDPVNQHQP